MGLLSWQHLSLLFVLLPGTLKNSVLRLVDVCEFVNTLFTGLNYEHILASLVTGFMFIPGSNAAADGLSLTVFSIVSVPYLCL
jgi:hypothetical protein